MGYYPILDRVPKGRDEGDAFQTWIPPPRRAQQPVTRAEAGATGLALRAPVRSAGRRSPQPGHETEPIRAKTMDTQGRGQL
jgi:hypothetical protein